MLLDDTAAAAAAAAAMAVDYKSLNIK